MIEIDNMLTKRALFCPEYATSEKDHMSRYLITLKNEIHEFVLTDQYRFLSELHPFSRRREIEIGL